MPFNKKASATLSNANQDTVEEFSNDEQDVRSSTGDYYVELSDGEQDAASSSADHVLRNSVDRQKASSLKRTADFTEDRNYESSTVAKKSKHFDFEDRAYYNYSASGDDFLVDERSDDFRSALMPSLMKMRQSSSAQQSVVHDFAIDERTKRQALDICGALAGPSSMRDYRQMAMSQIWPYQPAPQYHYSVQASKAHEYPHEHHGRGGYLGRSNHDQVWGKTFNEACSSQQALISEDQPLDLSLSGAYDLVEFEAFYDDFAAELNAAYPRKCPLASLRKIYAKTLKILTVNDAQYDEIRQIAQDCKLKTPHKIKFPMSYNGLCVLFISLVFHICNLSTKNIALLIKNPRGNRCSNPHFYNFTKAMRDILSENSNTYQFINSMQGEIRDINSILDQECLFPVGNIASTSQYTERNQGNPLRILGWDTAPRKARGQDNDYSPSNDEAFDRADLSSTGNQATTDSFPNNCNVNEQQLQPEMVEPSRSRCELEKSSSFPIDPPLPLLQFRSQFDELHKKFLEISTSKDFPQVELQRIYQYTLNILAETGECREEILSKVGSKFYNIGSQRRLHFDTNPFIIIYLTLILADKKNDDQFGLGYHYFSHKWIFQFLKENYPTCFKIHYPSFNKYIRDARHILSAHGKCRAYNTRDGIKAKDKSIAQYLRSWDVDEQRLQPEMVELSHSRCELEKSSLFPIDFLLPQFQSQFDELHKKFLTILPKIGVFPQDELERIYQYTHNIFTGTGECREKILRNLNSEVENGDKKYCLHANENPFIMIYCALMFYNKKNENRRSCDHISVESLFKLLQKHCPTCYGYTFFSKRLKKMKDILRSCGKLQTSFTTPPPPPSALQNPPPSFNLLAAPATSVNNCTAQQAYISTQQDHYIHRPIPVYHRDFTNMDRNSQMTAMPDMMRAPQQLSSSVGLPTHFAEQRHLREYWMRLNAEPSLNLQRMMPASVNDLQPSTFPATMTWQQHYDDQLRTARSSHTESELDKPETEPTSSVLSASVATKGVGANQQNPEENPVACHTAMSLL